MKVLLVLLLALALAGCGLVFPERQLGVQNMDGPPVTITVNDVPVAHLVCPTAEGGPSAITLRPGEGAVPATPWHLSVIEDDGTLLNAFDFENVDGSWVVLVRGPGSAQRWRAGTPGPNAPGPNRACPGGGLQ